ncbi:hypothetical protein [Granulicella sp. S156]|uniref:hypothetical protein n=1 Tax=Granulicella sp. S156 TaxID=1747224 RepID=UPI00131BEAB7|nr:hypothetical protein [Granulicella sp. S156]
MKKTSDELIHQALTGLRGAKPRDGMDQRLLGALEKHAAAPTPFWSRAIRLPWRWQFAAAIPVAAALVVTIAHLTLGNNVTTTATLQQPSAHTVIATNTSPKSICPSNESECPKPPVLETPRLQRVTKTTSTPDASQPNPLIANDQQALDDTNAPSHPAPPMPLTQQERLLLRATRRGEPTEVAELEPLREPARRATAKAREEAGLQQYAKLLLAPLVLSESLNPANSSQPHDNPQPSPAPEDSTPPNN